MINETDTNTDILFDVMQGEHGDLGLMTLNRSAVLNSLNHTMIHAMYAQLKEWAQDSTIKAVVIRAAEGRAFCAGGDLRLTYERRESKTVSLADFFRDEYQLNSLIFHYPKPYIALLDGITMGGGVGISINGSHRVATDKLLFAMPETSIGFFPDVGGTYFLPRISSHIGFYLGLTGARIKSDECVALGITQHKIASESIPELLKTLAQADLHLDAKASVTAIIDQFKAAVEPSTLMQHKRSIEDCFALPTMEEIVKTLHDSSHDICKEAGKMIATKSPTSLKVTLRALQQGRYLDFDDCMRQEYQLASHFVQSHDFFEGIRAVIIDKDLKPIWDPATLEAVRNQDIEKYFAP